MGNAVSENDEEGKHDHGTDADEDVSDQEGGEETDSRPTTDLSHLFSDNASLRAAAAKVKEKIPENVILQHNSHIMEWLETRLARLEDSISMAQFCEMLMDKGVERPEAIKAFHQFDCDGSGSADIQTMIETLEHYSSRSALGELGKSVRILQSCSLTPGFVDVYAGISDPVEKHGLRILKYLLRNRTGTDHLPFPFLNSFNIIHTMRSSVLKSIFEAAKDDLKDIDIEKDLGEMELRTTHNCFSSIEVSSNPSEAAHLRHSSMVWQSDGAARSHWVRLHIKSGIILKQLSIGVASCDESYMPEVVTISVGPSPSRLREIKETKIDKHFTGQVVLLRNMKVHHPYVQINIKRCHVDGCDTKIHGVKASGFKLERAQGITVMDASALWYIQMLTTTINFNLPQAPALRSVLLEHTKKALEFMPPLVLGPSSSEKPAFLNRHVLQEIESFAYQLSFSSESHNQLQSEGIQVVLALNLARGSVTGLVNLLTKIIELPSLTLPCADLLFKAICAKNTCLEKLGMPVPVTFVCGDGGPGMPNAGPEVLTESGSSGRKAASSKIYVTDELKTKCTLVYEVEQPVQLTKIRVQVASGSRGPRCGLIFVYNAEAVPELNPKFDGNEHINYLSKYDFWREKEFEFSVQYRNAGLGGMLDNPVAYFCLENDSDEIEVPARWGAVGKYIIIKFLEPRHQAALRLGIASIKFFGINKPVPLNSAIQKTIALPDATKKLNCDMVEICHWVLTFVTEIASNQLKRCTGLWQKSQLIFLDVSEIDLSRLWNLHLLCLKRADNVSSSSKDADIWCQCSSLSLQLIHGLIPALVNSKIISEESRDSLFNELCSIVNDQISEEKKTLNHPTNRLAIVKQIIIDGAPLFFPEKSKKRTELLKLLQTVSDQPSQPSMSLVFQSLCHFFSSVDPRGLLELPSTPTQEFSTTATLELMRSLLSVACQEISDLKRQVCLAKSQREKVRAEADSVKSLPPNSNELVDNDINKQVGDAVTNKAGAVSEVASVSDKGNSNSAGSSNNTTASAINLSKSLALAPLSNRVNNKGVASEQRGESASKDKLSTSADSCSENHGNMKSTGALSNPTHIDDRGGGGDEIVQGAIKTASCERADDDSIVEGEGRMVYLVKLAASLQTSLFLWIWQQLSTKSVTEDIKLSQTLQNLLKDYTQDVVQRANQFFEMFKTMEPVDLQKLFNREEPVFLSIIMRQLMLLLSSVIDKLNIETKVSLLQGVKKLITSVSDVAKANPDLFLNINSDCWEQVGMEETVLKTWEIDSPHPYHNHSNITEMFNCPGATKLVLEFDPRCETERRYDYLVFTDSKGLKLQFDQKVGTSKWPRKVTLSGPYVHFLFHSDSSNTEWGYKFTVTAHGTPDMQNSWLSDLQLALVKVVGQLCGATLSSNPIVPLETQMVGEESSEQDILRSSLWTSLFRGGYMAGKLERSLSGKFATSDNSHVHALLTELVNVASQREREPEGETSDLVWKQAKKLLTKCHEANKAKNAIRPGGKKVDEAVASLFAALVWHCQQLREDTEKFLNNEFASEVSDGIIQAYNVAESVRLSLASERQKWNSQDDGEKDLEADPADLFSSKAMYLLRFAGLTKVQIRNEVRSKFYKQMVQKKAGNKPSVMWLEGMDKFPSCRLVLEFIQDPAWTAEGVHQMLQERSKFASAISEVYLFATEMLRIMSHPDPFQIPVVLFFTEMFAYQHQFARHYAEGLDGCGLGQEARVRQGYYSLVRRFVEAFRHTREHGKNSRSAPAYDVLQCILLHLLDVDWQPYDLLFVHEMQLPQLFINFAKETVKMREVCVSDTTEEEELEEYKRFMAWFNKASEDDFGKWYSSHAADIEDKKALKWFVARFSDVLDVEITCDGCGVTLPGRRYRCLQCLDMDLCTACFSGGVEPEEHRDTHQIVHLVYKCNHCQGFIVSTRIHCNQCDDFDLCLGCHMKQKFPPGHTEKHDVTKIPMVNLKTSPSSNSSLQAYIHQHAWLLYASLTLTLSDAVYSQEAGLSYMDPDYLRVAGQLQRQCLDQAVCCLDQVAADVDGEAEEILSVEKRREQTFGVHSQERVLGLMGAVMPSELKKEHTDESGYNFCTEDFLNRLLKVSRGDQHTQHLALRLMGRLLAYSNTKMADLSTQRMVSADTKAVAGLQTLSHLFSFGARAFEKSGLEWACSVARMLEMLFGAHQWQQAIQHYISQCVQSLKHNVQPSSIFPMFVIAGFPEVLTTGTLVNYTYTSLESQSGVVLKHFPDKYQTLVVDLKSRKRHMVKDQQVTCLTDVADVLEAESIDKFVNFVTDSTTKIQAGEEVSVETLWMLSLTLKVLNRCFQSETMASSVNRNIFSGSFVQSLVSLGCKGTGLNQGWLLKDLEVLSLIWYTHDGSTAKKSRYNSLKKKKGGKKGKKRGRTHSKVSDEEEDDVEEMIALARKTCAVVAGKKYNGDDESNNSDDDGDDDDDDNNDDDDDDDDKSDDNLDYITNSSSMSSSSSNLSDMSNAEAKKKGNKGCKDDDDDDDDDDDSIWEDAVAAPSVKDRVPTPMPCSLSTEEEGASGDAAAAGATGKQAQSSSEPAPTPEDLRNELWSSLNLDKDMRKLLEALHTEMDIPFTALEAVLFLNQGNSEGIIKSIVENLGEDNDKLAVFLKKWENGEFETDQKEASSNESSALDTGITTHPSMDKDKKVIDTAVSERGENPQNLFQQQEVLAREISERQRGKSAQLLKKELEKHGRSGSREYLHKVNLAMCVLYARHTLTSLLAHWPEDGPAINSSLMGCRDVKQIPSVLDLLHKMDSRFFFSKVVDKVIHLCDPASLVPIAFTAAQFMEELTLQAVTCESSHNYTRSDKKKGHVTLPGASYLTVTFDARCATAEDDILKFSNSSKMEDTVLIFSGSSHAKWTSFNLPGDTLFFKFCLDAYDPSSTKYWGYKFTVTPGICDSFETGHTILKAVLSSSVARSLPLGQLWTSLVYVACKQPGIQRLKAINLMLKIVALQGKSSCGDQSKTRPDIDLSIVKPLWELYCSMTRTDKLSDKSSSAASASTGSEGGFQPAVTRALTDFFLHLENLACEWEMTEEYLASLMDINDISQMVFRGLANIAAVGHAIGYSNVATDLFVKSKQLLADGKAGLKGSPLLTRQLGRVNLLTDTKA